MVTNLMNSMCYFPFTPISSLNITYFLSHCSKLINLRKSTEDIFGMENKIMDVYHLRVELYHWTWPDWLLMKILTWVFSSCQIHSTPPIQNSNIKVYKFKYNSVFSSMKIQYLLVYYYSGTFDDHGSLFHDTFLNFFSKLNKFLTE